MGYCKKHGLSWKDDEERGEYFECSKCENEREWEEENEDDEDDTEEEDEE